MNHLLHEKYIGDALHSVALGRFLKNEECLISSTCDRIFLHVIRNKTLEKIKEKRVYRKIQGVAKIKEGGKTPETDGVFIHFEHARTSSLYFDEELQEFISTELRYYEKQEYGHVLGAEKQVNFFRVDNEHKIFFLLISKMCFSVGSTAGIGKSFVFEVNRIRPKNCVIKDAAFLCGFSAPTICFLFEDSSTDLCRIGVYSVDMDEKDLTVSFEIGSVPYGCYSVVPTEDRVFMVLGTNGALFYTQWEAVGVRFNRFWNIDQFGVDEVESPKKEFGIENGMCLVKGRDVFVFAEDVLMRLNVLGMGGRLSGLLVAEVDLAVGLDRPYSVATSGGLGCVSTEGGVYVVKLEKKAIAIEDRGAGHGGCVAREFIARFLLPENGGAGGADAGCEFEAAESGKKLPDKERGKKQGPKTPSHESSGAKSRKDRKKDAMEDVDTERAKKELEEMGKEAEKEKKVEKSAENREQKEHEVEHVVDKNAKSGKKKSAKHEKSQERTTEQIYKEMFKTSYAEDTEKTARRAKDTGEESCTHELSVVATKEAMGRITSAALIQYTDRKKEYLFTAGTKKQPLFIEVQEETELIFTKTSKIRGYLEIFPIDRAQKLYLITKERESTVIQWRDAIDSVESGIDKDRKTLLFSAAKTGHVQVTTHSVIYLTGLLRRTAQIEIPESVQAAKHRDRADNRTSTAPDSAEERIYVLTKEGTVLAVYNGKKHELPIKNVKTFVLHRNNLCCVDRQGRLLVYAAKSGAKIFANSLAYLLPTVLEDTEKNKHLAQYDQHAERSNTITEISGVEHLNSSYLVIRTANNEVVVYREGAEAQKDSAAPREGSTTYHRIKVENNSFYYERDDQTWVRRRSKVCENVVIVPGVFKTRLLFFTANGAYMHRSSTPIESAEETTEYKCRCVSETSRTHTEQCLNSARRTFVILAKGNLAEGFLPQYRYDKQMAYRKTKVESMCEKAVYYEKKKIFIASTYREIDYTKEMMPFTVLATTELEADKLPPPEIPEVELKPKTRAYHMKIFSQEELKKTRADEVLLSVDSFPLGTNEYVSFHKMVTLPDNQSTEGFADFLVVCTTYITDEDLISTGRMIVFEIATVVPERNRKETRHKLKPLAAEKTKGATTSCDVISSHIVVCVGTKLMVYAFDRNEGLKAMAFHDMQVFLTSCAVLRNILVCGDAYKGLFLLFYQKEPPILHMLSQSTGAIYLLKEVSMSLRGECCSLISCDSSRQLYIHSYSPQNILSRKGTRLTTRAECRLPDDIAGLIRVQYKDTHKTFVYTSSGYFYKHRMVDQNKHASLQDLQSSVQSHLQFTAGTCALSHWQIDKPAEMRDVTLKEVVQSGMVEEFYHMGQVRQMQVSSEAGRFSPGAVKTEFLIFEYEDRDSSR